jgi:hypothetical protein
MKKFIASCILMLVVLVTFGQVIPDSTFATPGAAAVGYFKANITVIVLLVLGLIQTILQTFDKFKSSTIWQLVWNMAVKAIYKYFGIESVMRHYSPSTKARFMTTEQIAKAKGITNTSEIHLLKSILK